MKTLPHSGLFAVEFGADLGVERPNHGLANAVRKAVMIAPVSNAYCSAHGIQEIDLPQIETMQAAMLFEVSGRQSDIGFKDHRASYNRYKKASCTAFKEYASLQKMSGMDACAEALEHMYMNSTHPHVRDIFEIVHDLDLIRCIDESSITSKIDASSDVKGLGQAITKGMLLVSEKAIQATGDRLMYSPSGGTLCMSRDKYLFPKCSTDAAACLQAVLIIFMYAAECLKLQKVMSTGACSCTKKD